MFRISSVFLITLIPIASFVAHAEKPFISDNKCAAAYRYYFLNRAIAFGDNYGAQIMLEQGADPNGRDYEINCVGGMEPDTPLFMATYKENMEMVKILLDAGSDPNVLVSECISPLSQAVERGRADIAELLLKKGSNISQDCGKSPIDIAKEKNDQNLIKLLEQYKKENQTHVRPRQ